MAAINGHFDTVSYLLDNAANPNLASEGGVTPLYAVINVQWQPRSFYPQPRAYLQQKIGYLELMTKLLDKGADAKIVNRRGQTTVDMANGPVQRTQPYPETIKLLESLGAKNNHKCVSC